MTRKTLSLFSGLSAAAFLASGCGSSSTQPATAARVTPEYDKGTGRLTRIAYDLKGGGRPDSWAYMDGARVVRVEIDEDGNGTIDRWEFHAQAISPLETLVRIERATRHDGRVSRWEYFERGALTKVEEDTDGDGKIDKWETYTGGTLTSMALDSSGHGTPDRRLLYKADGSFDRIETF